jgi:hypothetical protein
VHPSLDRSQLNSSPVSCVPKECLCSTAYLHGQSMYVFSLCPHAPRIDIQTQCTPTRCSPRSTCVRTFATITALLSSPHSCPTYLVGGALGSCNIAQHTMTRVTIRSHPALGRGARWMALKRTGILCSYSPQTSDSTMWNQYLLVHLCNIIVRSTDLLTLRWNTGAKPKVS